MTTTSQREQVELAARTLSRHAAIRRTGAPLPSVLVGDRDVLDPLLGSLVGTTPIDAACGTDAMATHLLARMRDAGLLEQLLTLAGEVLQEPDAADLRRRWTRLGAAEQASIVAALRDVGDDALADAIAIERASIDGRRTAQTDLDVVARLGRLPGLAFVPLAVHVHDEPGLHAALALLEHVPGLPLFVLAHRSTYDTVLARHRSSRVAALLEQGLVALDDPMATESHPTLPSAGAVATDDDATTVFRARAELALRPSDPELRELARSLAERALHDALQRRPSTRDRFRLNCAMPFTFGPRACEIDLCDRDARIAVEVDGYHHFTSHDAYRRDRRKDLLLQREGFVVLRFLDCDIFDRLAFVLEAIEDTLYHRRAAGR